MHIKLIDRLMLIPVKAMNSFSELLECYIGLLLVLFGLFWVVWSGLLHGGVLLFCHVSCGVVLLFAMSVQI